MFMCDHPELMQVREVFLAELYAKIPEFKGAFTQVMPFFKAVLAKREITPGLGKVAFNVLKIYDATPGSRRQSAQMLDFLSFDELEPEKGKIGMGMIPRL